MAELYCLLAINTIFLVYKFFWLVGNSTYRKLALVPMHALASGSKFYNYILLPNFHTFVMNPEFGTIQYILRSERSRAYAELYLAKEVFPFGMSESTGNLIFHCRSYFLRVKVIYNSILVNKYLLKNAFG